MMSKALLRSGSHGFKYRHFSFFKYINGHFKYYHQDADIALMDKADNIYHDMEEEEL